MPTAGALSNNAAAATDSAPVVPEGWEAVHDHIGRLYYVDHNSERNATSGKVVKAAQATWYWEESDARVGSHDTASLLPSTNFVRFPNAISSFVEVSYQLYKTKNGTPVCGLPAHTSKWVAKETGDRGVYFYHTTTHETTWTPPADYEVDFATMTQTKLLTKYVRPVKRVETKAAVYGTASPGPRRRTTTRTEGGRKKKKASNTTSMPDQVLEQDGLMIEDGDLIQVKAETDDKLWSYGTILVRGNADDDDDNHKANGSNKPRRSSSVLNSDETGVSNETGKSRLQLLCILVMFL